MFCLLVFYSTSRTFILTWSGLVFHTLSGETFARETFANFANFGLFRESLTREKFEIIHSRKFVPWNSIHFSLPNFWKMKDPDIIFFLRKLSKNFFKDSLIRESLSRKMFCIPWFAKVYPKNFANFWPRESFFCESFSD